MSQDPSKKYAHLPLVPETTLKNRHDLDALTRKRAALNEQNKVYRQRRVPHGKKAIIVKKPETYIVQGRSRRCNAIRFKRVLRKGMQKRASNKPIMATKEIVDPNDENKVVQVQYQANSVGTKTCVFVIRIRDDIGLPYRMAKILKDLRLESKHDGVFVKYDEVMRKKLHLIENWVIYGVPCKAVVEDLITRRGFGKEDDARVPLSDNVTVEKALGKEHGLICVEDLVHEIYNAGPEFEAASKFLWPFKLTDSKTVFERRTLRMKDGKKYGDQGEGIDEFIQLVL